MAGLYMPLSTLQGWPRGQPHMTQGRYGSLRLYRMTLSFTTTCRFSPALSGDPPMKQNRRNFMKGTGAARALALTNGLPGALTRTELGARGAGGMAGGLTPLS